MSCLPCAHLRDKACGFVSYKTSRLRMATVHEVSSPSAQALAASGKLGKLKVDDLKPYLRAHGLKVTGKKDDLIERITEHVNSQP